MCTFSILIRINDFLHFQRGTFLLDYTSSPRRFKISHGAIHHEYREHLPQWFVLSCRASLHIMVISADALSLAVPCNISLSPFRSTDWSLMLCTRSGSCVRCTRMINCVLVENILQPRTTMVSGRIAAQGKIKGRHCDSILCRCRRWQWQWRAAILGGKIPHAMHSSIVRTFPHAVKCWHVRRKQLTITATRFHHCCHWSFN